MRTGYRYITLKIIVTQNVPISNFLPHALPRPPNILVYCGPYLDTPHHLIVTRHQLGYVSA